MIKQFFFKTNNVLFFAVTILMAACNNGGSDKNNADKIVTDSNNTPSPTQAVVTQAALIPPGGKLDTLWVDSLSFTKLPDGKMVFSFTFGQLDTLTLHGWDAKGLLQHNYDSIPDIRLKKGKPSELTYGPGTYFGNIILDGAIASIKKSLKKNHSQYVLFAPKKIGEHISYEILISKEDPNAFVKIFAAMPTGITANPSPPKKY